MALHFRGGLIKGDIIIFVSPIFTTAYFLLEAQGEKLTMSINLSKQNKDHLLEICSRLKQQPNINPNEITELEDFIKCLKYGLAFEQHEEEVDRQLKTCVPAFIELENKCLNENKSSSDCNFLLEGDNLHSLKLLEKTHQGRIDVIYIDPPYNTGNEDFIYADKMVDTNDGFRHSKWLSFMKERLVIARRLLTDDGVIFISIDDNEQANLKLLCDSIFGESNCIANIAVINNESGRSDDTYFATSKEYLYCYAKNAKKAHIVGFRPEEKYIKQFKYFDKWGPYKLSDLKKTGKNCKKKTDLICIIQFITMIRTKLLNYQEHQMMILKYFLP